MDFCLWSRIAVGQLIEQEFGIECLIAIIYVFNYHLVCSIQAGGGYGASRSERYV